MKTLSIFFLIIFLAAGSQAQSQASFRPKVSLLDKSPMDMAYFPNNYPVLRAQDKAAEPLIARVIYSRPQKNDRTVFGELVEYGSIWRLGANEATEIEFFRDVKISGKKLLKGRYTMYAIPTATNWTIIFNKDNDIWGAFKYDEKKDALRVQAPIQKNTVPADAFTIDFVKTTAGTDLFFAWDDVSVALPISLK